MFKAYYWKWSELYSTPFDTHDDATHYDATHYLSNGANNFQLSQIGVLNTETHELVCMNSLYDAEISKQYVFECDNDIVLSTTYQEI